MIALIGPHHVETVCQPGRPACCCYLIMGPDGFECAKHTSFKVLLDNRVAAGTMRAVGDNCKGMVPMPQTMATKS